jgi:hypothetical protein
MSCQCHQIGGPFIAEDPDCEAHGVAAQERQAESEEIYLSPDQVMLLETVLADAFHNTEREDADVFTLIMAALDSKDTKRIILLKD